MTYESAKEKLGNRESRKLENNTYLVKDGNHVAVKLHATNVITFRDDGQIVVDSGGYATVTTKDRINKYLPDPWRMYQEKSTWYLTKGYHGETHDRYRFSRKAILMPNGEVVGAVLYDPKLEKKEQTMIRKANQFAKNYVEALFKGKVQAPDAGDCWYCAMRDSSGKTLGELGRDNADHIEGHIKEKYYVPSMIFRASEVFGVSIAAKSVLFSIWDGSYTPNDWLDGVAKEQLQKSLARYVKRQLGFAS